MKATQQGDKNMNKAKKKETKARFEEMMIKQTSGRWSSMGGTTGQTTRAIINGSLDPLEMVNDIESAELLHPDTLNVIKGNLKKWAEGKNPQLF
jgi:hypothetical protein